jgi:acetyl/propionyl-CoA carboxylase alpha subunit
MRVCTSPEEISNALASAQREALSSFGNGDVLVEKYITNPRHIEVQILATKDGNCFHLFERECSIQRRHQKIIEEAPSPFIGSDEITRKLICDAAVTLAKAVKYDSAGTVEFVMDDNKNFYFLEMNTRIQVEHAITEEITGIDLVRNMILGALSLPLDIKNQSEITIQGHAIEARICCEDPQTFLPAPGTVTFFNHTLLQGMRFDHCIFPGLCILPDFDPMIGKLIAKGINRSVAIAKITKGLELLKLGGARVNIPLLIAVMKNLDFCAGKFNTNFLEINKNNFILNRNEEIMELNIANIIGSLNITI